MSWILIFTTLFSWSSPRVGPSKLMQCLGLQEQYFHKQKLAGPFVELNQAIIGELIQLTGIEGSKTLLRTVCRPSKTRPLELIEAMLLDPHGWYAITPKLSGLELNISKELVKEMKQMLPEILLAFLSAVQGQMPTPDCLEKNIAGLTKLYQDVKWLQEEMDLSKITNARRRLVPIFKALHRYQEIAQMCERSKSKKTATGSGNPSAQ
jgi:hypothetical protein